MSLFFRGWAMKQLATAVNAYRDRASVRSMPFLLLLKRTGTSVSIPEQTGRGDKEIIHQGKDTAGCSSERRSS